MTDWATLHDAYGPADEVPAILARADASGTEFGDAWNDAWSHLCHQGTVYTASYAALPLLLDIAERRPPTGYLAALGLAACIVSSGDGPRESASIRQEYAATIGDLRRLAESNLPSATSDPDFIYSLEALLAFENGGVWQRALSHLADEEVPVTCPACTELLVLDPKAGTVAAFPGGGRTSGVEADAPAPGTLGDRMVGLAAAHGHPEVAAQIGLLFGRSSCPKCGAAFDVPDGVQGYYA